MADYDLYSDVKPVLGTNAGVAFNGVASLTPSIDTQYAKSVTAIAVTTTAIAWNDMTLSFTDSDDNVTFSPVDAEQVLFRKPINGAATSRVFHAGYIGKKRYVRAVGETTLGTELGQITLVLGQLRMPFDQSEIEE